MPHVKHNGAKMEYIRASVTASAANAYTPVEVSTPVSGLQAITIAGQPQPKMFPAMLIHEIETFLPPMDPAADDDSTEAQVTSEAKSAIASLADGDELDTQSQETVLLTSGAYGYNRKRVRKFDPPILYAKSTIHFASDQNAFAAVAVTSWKVGYTLEMVDNAVYIAALVD